jgi:hypothetical protein
MRNYFLASPQILMPARAQAASGAKPLPPALRADLSSRGPGPGESIRDKLFSRCPLPQRLGMAGRRRVR